MSQPEQMTRRPIVQRWQWILLPSFLIVPLLVLRADETEFHQHEFENRQTAWTPGAADAVFKETAHRLTEETAHGGHRSEYIEIQAQPGHHVYYTYSVGRAPVQDELVASVWVKANRPGVQILARVVLPHEPDPSNLSQPVTTLIRGDVYQTAGRWQRLELRQPVKTLREQQVLLRAERKRDVNIVDAYLDQLVLNVYGGPGLTRVWTDDLEIGPVLRAKKETPVATTERSPTPVAPQRRTAEVQLKREQLWIRNPSGSGRDGPFFLRGIRHSGTPLRMLREAGFNTVWFDEGTEPATLEQAANLGFWLVPMLTPEQRPPLTADRGPVEGQLTSASSTQLVGRRMSRFLQQDAVLAWDLGGGLSSEQYVSLTRTAEAVRTFDPMRPVAVDVWDGFQRYSRRIDQLMLGVHRWPLMTGLELGQYRDWLTQRRQLAQPGTFVWTWIQTHLPDWYVNQVYEKPAALGFQEPVGPQPEQIRLLTYTALASGYRGLGFWSDRFLADSHTGRDRLLQMALLNLELTMLEPLLVSAQAPVWVGTSANEVKAAVMRTDYGVLCLPLWVGKGAQFVPGQSATNNLTVVVPQVPAGTQAWLITPSEVRTLRCERVVGGTKVTIPEFGLTAAIVFTGDLSRDGLIVNLQNQTRLLGPSAAQWGHDLAQEEYAKVAKIQEQLEEMGHRLPDGPALMEDSRRRIQLCANHWRSGNMVEACAEAERAVRPLRIVMRAQWEKATKELDTPTASPYAVSFYTLPRHWRFREELTRGKLTANTLPGGDFEDSGTGTQRVGFRGDASGLNMPEGWQIHEESSLDEVKCSANWVTEGARQGKRSLQLEIKATDEKRVPTALERTFLAAYSPAIPMPAGTLVRISGWIRIPKPITATADGVLLFDSAGGEALAVRLVDAIPKWKQFSLYRRVPASGTIHVTLALSGLGQVFFDDIKIEPISR